MCNQYYMGKCCNCTTTWTCEKIDLVFKVWYNFSDTYSPSSPGSDWTWSYSVGVPNDGQYKIVAVSPDAKSELISGPSSSCNCTDNSSGTIVAENEADEEENELGYFEPTYQGKWRRTGSNGQTQTVYGVAYWRADRYSIRKKKFVDYENKHKCGDGCPGGTKNWDWDNIESIENAWETWEPY